MSKLLDSVLLNLYFIVLAVEMTNAHDGLLQGYYKITYIMPDVPRKRMNVSFLKRLIGGRNIRSGLETEKSTSVQSVIITYRRKLSLLYTTWEPFLDCLREMDERKIVTSLGIVSAAGVLFAALIRTLPFCKEIFSSQLGKQTQRRISIVKHSEEAKLLHKYVCGSCGYTIYPARGRESRFFGEDFTCPICNATKSNFSDMSATDGTKRNSSFTGDRGHA